MIGTMSLRMRKNSLNDMAITAHPPMIKEAARNSFHPVCAHASFHGNERCIVWVWFDDSALSGFS